MLSFGFLLIGIRSFSKLILDIVNKDLRISKIFLKESFKVKLCNRNSILITAFIIGLSKVDGAIKKMR